MPQHNRRLTPKQQRFVELYLTDLNATQAAVKAGYHAKMAAKLVAKNSIQEAIQKGRAELSKEARVEAKDVIRRLAAEAFSDIFNIVQIKDGQLQFAVRDSDKLHPLDRAAVASISQTAKGEIRVKMKNSTAALDKLGRHLGLFDDIPGGQTSEHEFLARLRAEALKDDVAVSLMLQLAERLGIAAPKQIPSEVVEASKEKASPSPQEDVPPGDEMMPAELDDVLQRYLKRPTVNGESAGTK